MRLKEIDSAEGEFYDGIAKHVRPEDLTGDQWFELRSRLPNKILWSQFELEKMLSEEQMKRLPPFTA